MKTALLTLVLALTGLELWAQSPPGLPAPSTPPNSRLPRFGSTNGPVTQPRYQSPGTTPGAGPGFPSAAAQPSAAPNYLPSDAGTVPEKEKEVAAYKYNFQGVDLNQFLELYADLVGRTLLRANLPDTKIVLKTQSPLTRTEAIQAFQAVLALNNISVVNIGEKFVKVAQSDQANTLGAELDRSGSTNLPSLGTYVTHITQLRYVKPTVMMPLLTPFAKLPNAVFPIDDNGILVIRDYAENVKRMLEMIDQIDVSVPAEYISEVIPIRYAKVDDIASALNSLGGSGGGATVSIGGGTSSGQISGLAGNRSSGLSGMGGMSGGIGGNNYQSGNMGGNSAFGNRTTTGLGGTTVNPNGTPTSGTTFAQRLNNIINSAGATGGTGGAGGGKQEPIQLFGQTKIIPNESSSSLLIYATRADMSVITNIIAKLDVPLAQVLVEAVIIDYTLGNTFNFGTSVAQNPKSFANNSSNILQTVSGAGGMNNGVSFLNFLNAAGTNSTFGNNLGSGLSYFGNIGPTWDVAVSAAQSDSHASIIQRPRIQTSQAQPAQFFVGSSVPYATGSYTYTGTTTSYSQLSVGVELDVTPFINPEGAVSMQIQQEIDAIDNPNYNSTGQPSTIKRTLNTTITVRDKDTVMLGGFIEADKSTSSSGVPFLSDIPVLGNLFKQRNDSKARKELIVLMRPTVLQTPELAAKNTFKEERLLPGISATAAEGAAEERKLIDAQRKSEQKEFKKTGQYDGFFVPAPDENSPTNAPLTEKEAQEKARAAMLQKMSALDNGTNR